MSQVRRRKTAPRDRAARNNEKFLRRHHRPLSSRAQRGIALGFLATRPLGRRANRCSPHSIPQFIERGNVLPGVPYQVKRRDKQRNRAPWSEQHILPRELPIMLVYARFTQVAVYLVLPPPQQLPHIAVKRHILRRTPAPTPLAKPGCKPRRLQVRRRHRPPPKGWPIAPILRPTQIPSQVNKIRTPTSAR